MSHCLKTTINESKPKKFKKKLEKITPHLSSLNQSTKLLGNQTNEISAKLHKIINCT